MFVRCVLTKRFRLHLLMTSEQENDPFEALWDEECEVCGDTPIVAGSGMCGPCTFGESDTINGNW